MAPPYVIYKYSKKSTHEYKQQIFVSLDPPKCHVKGKILTKKNWDSENVCVVQSIAHLQGDDVNTVIGKGLTGRKKT